MATKRSEKKCIDSGRFEDIYPVCNEELRLHKTL